LQRLLLKIDGITRLSVFVQAVGLEQRRGNEPGEREGDEKNQ
jgi:hypothetical protein